MAFFSLYPNRDGTSQFQNWEILLQDMPDSGPRLILTELFGVYQRIKDDPRQFDVLAWKISSELEILASTLDHEQRMDFQMTFMDLGLAGQSTFLSMRGQSDISRSEEWMLYAAFFKALHLYLTRENRVEDFHARYANLFVVWQWFGLLKRLTLDMEPESGGWNDELAQAYQTLLELIRSPLYAQQLRWLSKQGGFKLDTGPLLREQILLSLPLWQNKLDRKDQLNKPLPSPGCSRNAEGMKMLCGEVKLHPWLVSESTGGQQAVRQVISAYLLPSYDLSTSFHLARLLHRGTVLRFVPFWQANLAGLIGVAVLVFGSTFASSQSGPAVPYWALAGFQFALGSVAVVLLTKKGIGYQSLQYFLFPRLLGGILIGYLAIILQSDSISLRAALWQRGWFGIGGLWLGIGALGLGYLFFDTLPLVGKWKVALARALEMLLLVLSAPLLVGLFLLPVFTAAFSDRYVFGLLILGPMGYLSLWDLLAFSPVALFTGLVTQFIFERETITSSVWSAEQE